MHFPESGWGDGSDKLLHQAYHLFPRYHYTVAQLARLRIAQKKYKEAVAHGRDLYKAGANPENLYLLAETLERAGETKEAESCFATFEKAALAESGKGDNANRELIYYYIDHARRPAEALRLSESEVARRQDVHTLRAHAWALCAAGRPAEGLKEIDRALAVGIRDAGFFYHAGVIAGKAGDAAAARRHLHASLDLAPQSEWSDRAEAALAELNASAPRLAAPLAEPK